MCDTVVVGVVVFANNTRDITTSVSLEDRLDNRDDFYRQKSSFKGRHRQFSEKCGTLFQINVRFTWYIFQG